MNDAARGQQVSRRNVGLRNTRAISASHAAGSSRTAATASARASAAVGEREVVTVALVVLVQLPDAGEVRAVAEPCGDALHKPGASRSSVSTVPSKPTA